MENTSAPPSDLCYFLYLKLQLKNRIFSMCFSPSLVHCVNTQNWSVFSSPELLVSSLYTMETDTPNILNLELHPTPTAYGKQLSQILCSTSLGHPWRFSHIHIQEVNVDTLKSPRRDVKRPHLEKSLDDKFNSQIIRFNGLISVVFLQELTHRLGSSANGISLETLRGNRKWMGV